MSRWLLTSGLALMLTSIAQAGYVSTFEDQGLPPNSFSNNAPGGVFVSGGNRFNNNHGFVFGFEVWSGWAISSMTDTTTPGFANQYSAITGTGADGSPTYGVAYTFGHPGTTNPFRPDSSFVDLAPGTSPVSIQVTNTTYAVLSMRNGDDFAHKFGDGDFFLLTITGYDSLGGTGGTVGEVNFYLANFLQGNAYIVDTWQTVDLTSLNGAKSLRFALQSSDNHPQFGMNTPAYFAADNLTVATPEPSSLALVGVGIVGLGLTRLRRWK
jgi:hypothetical protein